MKTMNRRDFLKLTGASAVMLTFAACGADNAPAAPTIGKEAQIENAINAYRREKGLKELKHEDAIAEYAGMYTSLCEAHGTTSIDWDDLTELEEANIGKLQARVLEAHFSMDAIKDAVTIGMGEDEDGNSKLVYTFPANDAELSTQLVPHKENIAKAELRYIGVSTATVEGKTYWMACLVGKKVTDTE